MAKLPTPHELMASRKDFPAGSWLDVKPEFAPGSFCYPAKVETMERLPLMVIKKDGGRQAFDRSKLLSSMLKACEKRSVPMSKLEKIACEIEQALQNDMDREIPSAKIGELVMDRLRGVDEVAYVRFASVYRQFKDISTFMSELSKLLAEK